ncbi:type A2 lantipeptide [Streptomyces sp. RB6PN25]|uniref:Type A2 lantipeptide n=1 Tax=Streptomyces humicola TaxID=2953240 RepID=A0ABT1PVP0_9ACTN|nr:type A2 lantipeptide [Streptomyces humicola]MCQ4081734.1 type A2 lantipeptide [Streptomyces humicola]
MRKDFTPEVETREIAESDLDNVSGGHHHAIHRLAHAIHHVESELAASSVSGGAGLQATGLIPGQAGFSGSAGS